MIETSAATATLVVREVGGDLLVEIRCEDIHERRRLIDSAKRSLKPHCGYFVRGTRQWRIPRYRHAKVAGWAERVGIAVDTPRVGEDAHGNG